MSGWNKSLRWGCWRRRGTGRRTLEVCRLEGWPRRWWLALGIIDVLGRIRNSWSCASILNKVGNIRRCLAVLQCYSHTLATFVISDTDGGKGIGVVPKVALDELQSIFLEILTLIEVSLPFAIPSERRIFQSTDEVLVVLVIRSNGRLCLVELAGDLVQVSTLDQAALSCVAIDLDAILLIALSGLVDVVLLGLFVLKELVNGRD